MSTKAVRKEKLIFEDPDALQLLVGGNNARLKLIERSAGVTLHLRGNELTIEAEPDLAGRTRSALEQLYRMGLRGQAPSSDDVVRMLRALEMGEGAGPIEVGETLVTLRSGRAISPKGAAQSAYVDLIRNQDIVFGVGPAGTGKTYLAMAMAVRALSDKAVRRIVLTRPAVEAGERLGFLPGTLEEKVDPYLRPLVDALHEMLDPERVQRFIADSVIEIAPLAFMRGRTLNDAFIVLDEAQNTTPEQMKMFLTRLGFGGKAVITGDPTQTDLPRGARSGLRDALDLLADIRGIGIARFTDADVVRHPLVAAIIRAYDARDRSRNEQRVVPPTVMPSAAGAEEAVVRDPRD